MRTVLLVVGLAAAAALAVPAVAQTETDQTPQVHAQQYVKLLVGFMSNPDPRLRFSVREALRIMGPLAVPVINEAKAKETNPHVKAFMERTVRILKTRAPGVRRPRGRDRRGRGPFGRRLQEIDIDRVAMEANLTWEQMDKVLPILKRVRREVADLWQEFREAGGMRDPEAWQDLREELQAIAKEAEPKLREILNEKQLAAVRRLLNPMPRMRGRMFGGRPFHRPGERGGRPPFHSQA